MFLGILTTTWCDPQRSVSLRRIATRFFGSKKIAAALGVPVSTTQRWLQRLRSDGDMASRNIGRPRGAEAGVCVMFSFHVSSHISRRVICVSRLWVHGCNEERVRAAALINAWISIDACCTVASVRKRLQASGIERSRRSVHEYTAAEHWPPKQVIRGKNDVFFC